MLDLHPNAVIAYNQTAESCAGLIKTIQSDKITNQKFSPDFHPIFSTTSEQAILGISWQQDVFGNKTSIYLDREHRIGIFEEDYVEVRLFLESLVKSKKVGNKISFKTLENIFQKWAIERFIDKNNVDFVSQLNLELENLLKIHDIWVPIEFLSIEKEFTIGKVKFQPIKKDTIDTIKYLSLEKILNEDEKAKIEMLFEKQIRNVQGYTVARLLIESEFERACEIALEEVKKSLSILRLFSVAMYEPKLFYSGTIWGSSHIDHANIISLDNGAMSTFKMHRLDRRPHMEQLDSAMIDQIFICGLGVLDTLLGAEKLSRFQERLLNCLMLFSRSTTAKDSSDKLIYILTSLESFFLRSASEPIQQNLGERIAFLIKQSPDERKEVVNLVRRTYDLRSKFIHHGTPISDYDTFKGFMRIATDTVIVLIGYAYKFDTPELLMDELDMRKYS